MKKKISIVVPIFNEEKNILVLCEELLKLTKSIPDFDYEIILIDDGSSDNSWQNINCLASQNVHIKGIKLSRNFGHQIALSAGYDFATGDAIISMDADMQHPPHILPAMIKKWLDGYAIVYVKSVTRNDRFLKKITALMYYRLLQSIAEVIIPRNVADFRLIDKKVADALRQSKEKTRYLRGMVAWTGFKHSIVTCQFSDRLSGVSGYTWKKMIKLAFDGITSFSHFPLKIIVYAVGFVFFSGLCMAMYLLYSTLCCHKSYALFKWLMVVVYLCMGIQLFLSGLIGEYISRVYNQLKDRPLYIISQTFNIK